MAGWPAENAALLEVAGPGVPDSYGEVGDDAGDALWEGEIGCVLIRTRKQAFSGDGNAPVETDIVIVRKPPDAVAGIATGDQATAPTLLVEDRRTATTKTSRFRVVRAEHRGHGEARSARFELADERPTEGGGS